MISFFKRMYFRFFGSKAQVIPIVVPSVEIPAEYGLTPGFYIGKVEGATAGELIMVGEAVELLQRHVMTPRFRAAVLSKIFTSFNGLSNAQIADKFQTSALSVNVKFFTGSFKQNRIYKTVGLDSSTDDFVWANRYFVKDKKTLASLILHELAHSLGFSHSSAKEYTSVPYQMNTILEALMNAEV